MATKEEKKKELSGWLRFNIAMTFQQLCSAEIDMTVTWWL
jgi:hypothetical protein